MCVGRDLQQLLDLDEAKCKQSSAAAVPPWLPFSSAPSSGTAAPAQACGVDSFPLYPDRKGESHQTAPGGRTGCVSGPCQLGVGMQSWLLQGRNGIINTSCVICSECVSLTAGGVHYLDWMAFIPLVVLWGFLSWAVAVPAGSGQWELWFLLGRMGSQWKTARVDLPLNRATSLESLVCTASTSSWYLWVTGCSEQHPQGFCCYFRVLFLSLSHQNCATVLGILRAKQQVLGTYQVFAERISF